ncbi:MAG: PstS family phosphate ABC transporter substrate-binding protein [Gammaproteobacteria bacterium]|nr:PstS family phosphate ABC transporter substrate-binding protein [Gammaproteobacteria bacterium]
MLASVVVTATVSGTAIAQAGRDYIYIVGSSTVYPFATVVAERFGRGTEFKTPKVEATGSGGGLKLFCDGVGVDFPDIANASRAIKQSEVDNCASNGVTEIVEVKTGYDGIVIANAIAATSVNLSRADIFLALAREVPGENEGELIENPYKTWSDVNAELPDVRIEVRGPPPTSGTRDAFVELAMEGGCTSIPWIRALRNTDTDSYKTICHTIREDGAFVEAGENDNLIVQKLEANPNAFGIFGFSFLDQNAEKVKGAKVDGVAPTFDAIADGDYPVSRPLFFYVKKAHVDVIPGLRGFLREFTSERAWGDEGYLSDRGLIPMPEEERGSVAARVRDLTPLSMVSQ